MHAYENLVVLRDRSRHVPDLDNFRRTIVGENGGLHAKAIRTSSRAGSAEADSANLGEVRAERATVPDAVLDAVTAGVLSRLRPRYAANRAGSAKLSGRPTTRHPC